MDYKSLNVNQLLGKLISNWSGWEEHKDYYLKELVPSFITNPNFEATSKVEKVEKEIITELKARLNDEEWQVLPELIIEQRLGKLRIIESEHQRQGMEELIKRERASQEAIEKEKSIKKLEIIKQVKKKFAEDFLNADSFYESSCANFISFDEYQKEKIVFVQSWIRKETDLELDEEQAAAVGSNNGNFQIVARAGSGKTRVVANRTIFLQKHCGISPSQMLLLAFNKKAAEEMRKRLDEKLNGMIPHVMTFHALAYAIVKPEESLLKDDEIDMTKSALVQDVIDDHLQDQGFKDRIRDLMLAHFRQDWDRIVEGYYDRSKEELLDYRRSLIRESLRGEYVKSFGEKTIANFLFEHDIDYRYERNFIWDGINYKPDFTVFKTQDSGIIIEYFGLKGDPDYDEMSQKKREFWFRQKNWGLLEFSPKDISSNGVEDFWRRLKEALERRGIHCNKLSEDEIWQRVRKRAIDKFTMAMSNFIGRCRKYWFTPERLSQLIQSYKPISSIEEKFINIAQNLYDSYLKRLIAIGEEDFDGLLQRAIENINSGKTKFLRKSGLIDINELKYVFIDEFQDFSELFYQLIDSIHRQIPSVEFFCVGDDWQAINGFAGSEIKFFRNFGDFFSKSNRLYISTNYRSSQSVVNIGNALMANFGNPARVKKSNEGKGNVLLADLSSFNPSPKEREVHYDDKLTPGLIRLIGKVLSEGFPVVLLCRRNSISWYIKENQNLERYLERIRDFFPKSLQELITISTIHKYKGLEKHNVIIIDAVMRSYPLLHPDWIFLRIFGDNPEKIVEEERRLFYVALTRAIENLYIITEKENSSPFLQEIERQQKITPLNWEDYPVWNGQSDRFIVMVGNQVTKGYQPTVKIKDYLRAAGFRWQTNSWQAWVKSYPKKGFSIEILQNEVWASKADGILVKILDEYDNLLEQYLINRGKWQLIVTN